MTLTLAGDGAVRKDPKGPARVSRGGEHVLRSEEAADGDDGEGTRQTNNARTGTRLLRHSRQKLRCHM